MPCCIGIIDYAQCRHSTLYKLGCTAGCEELCSPAQQEVLLRARFRWRCEECHGLRYATDADARTDRWNDQARRIIEKDGGSCDGYKCNGEGEMRMLALRDREEFEEQLQEERRVAQVEEIQYAEEWTNQYGRAVFAMRYGGSRGRRQRERQRQWWQRQEEEQRSEEDDDEADGACGTESRPRAEDRPGDDDGLHLRRYPDQQQRQPPGAMDDDGKEAAKRQVDKLRSVQQWDLVILGDALRSDKELRELRHENRRLAQGESDKHGIGSRPVRAADGWRTTSGHED